MLKEILACFASGQSYTMMALAAELGVSESLLEQMLADLERAGYLAAADMGCEGRCAGCPSSGLCALLHGKRIWTLTAKGRRAAG
jgi:predicted DNA-binding transcriptional regulator YafY